MSEHRVYPRIQSDWKLYLESGEGKREVGYVKDISLSGASLHFTTECGLEPGKHRFTLKLTNSQLEPAELIISGLKEWERREENEVFLGIALDRLDREKRSGFVRFLSRSKSCILAHGPEPSAIHRRLNSTGKRVFCRKTQALIIIESGHIIRCVDAFEGHPGSC